MLLARFDRPPYTARVGYELPKAVERERQLQEELRRLLPRIIELGADRVILFGSLARGIPRSSSDIDLLIVMESDRRFLDRLGEVYDAIQPRYAADILVYTPGELEELKHTSSFLRGVLEEGEVLYDQSSSR